MEKIMADKLIRLEPGGKFCFKKEQAIKCFGECHR